MADTRPVEAERELHAALLALARLLARQAAADWVAGEIPDNTSREEIVL